MSRDFYLVRLENLSKVVSAHWCRDWSRKTSFMSKIATIDKYFSAELLCKLQDHLKDNPELEPIVCLLIEHDESSIHWRERFGRALEMAEKYGLIDKDFESRVFPSNWKKFKWSVFYQFIRNIQIAQFFIEELKLTVKFNPKGRASRIGEYLIASSDCSEIFCEVKTPIRETPLKIWSGDDADVIEASIKQATKQLPDTCSTLVIFAGKLRAPVSSDHRTVCKALYGEDVFRFLIGKQGPLTDVSLVREQNGIFQVGSNRRISAVAIFDDFYGSPYLDECLKRTCVGINEPPDDSIPMHSFHYVFKVYHNPFAKNPIRLNLFKSYKQFSLDVRTRRVNEIKISTDSV